MSIGTRLLRQEYEAAVLDIMQIKVRLMGLCSGLLSSSFSITSIILQDGEKIDIIAARNLWLKHVIRNPKLLTFQTLTPLAVKAMPVPLTRSCPTT